jgi:hypothetical protein
LQRGLPQPAKIGSVDPKKDLALATKAHREWVEKRGPGLEIVGANNVGEITFNLEDTDPTIRIAQKLWFRSPASADPAPNTTHIVSLEYEDLRYPDPESQVILGP